MAEGLEPGHAREAQGHELDGSEGDVELVEREGGLRDAGLQLLGLRRNPSCLVSKHVPLRERRLNDVVGHSVATIT